MPHPSFCRFFRCALGGAAIVCAIPLSAQFTPGQLAILEMPFIWNGSTWVVPTTGSALWIREYATDGTPGFSVPIPSTGPDMLVLPFVSSGVSLGRSPSGDKLVFPGYTATSNGSFNLTTSSATLVPRGIGTVDAAGNYARPVTTSTFFDGGIMRTACTDGTNFWAGGSNSGVCYLGPGTPATINNTVTSTEDLHLVAGSLVRVGNGTVHRINGGAATTAQAQNLLFSPSSAIGLCMNDAGDVAYTNTSFQIRKWVLSGGVWTNVYSFTVGSFLVRMVVDFSAAQPIIYAVKNTSSSLVKIVDAGATSPVVTLATMPGAAW